MSLIFSDQRGGCSHICICHRDVKLLCAVREGFL
jgi:hypothetical protein